MAPRKPTTKAASSSSDPDPNDLILNYLKTQNRPYSAIEISSNLHNKVTKTKTDKLLKEMFERGDIGGKASGKCWVFWWGQDSKDNATAEELLELSNAIVALREVLPGLKALLKGKTAELAEVCSVPTTEVLRASVMGLEKRREEVEGRLVVLRSGSVKPLSLEERERVLRDHRMWKGKEVRRKRIWKEAEGMLLDGMTKEELYDKLGIDEDA